jgi:cell division septum initiation protein DivIVA
MKNGIKEVLESEREARRIIDCAQNEAESIRINAEKEAKRIIINAEKEAKSIISGYKLHLSTALKKEKKEVEKKGINLKNDWIKRYEKEKERLLAELIDASIKRK